MPKPEQFNPVHESFDSEADKVVAEFSDRGVTRNAEHFIVPTPAGTEVYIPLKPAIQLYENDDPAKKKGDPIPIRARIEGYLNGTYQ